VWISSFCHADSLAPVSNLWKFKTAPLPNVCAEKASVCGEKAGRFAAVLAASSTVEGITLQGHFAGGKWELTRWIAGDDDAQGEILVLHPDTIVRVRLYRFP
jgi:hypothetical protein